MTGSVSTARISTKNSKMVLYEVVCTKFPRRRNLLSQAFLKPQHLRAPAEFCARMREALAQQADACEIHSRGLRCVAKLRENLSSRPSLPCRATTWPPEISLLTPYRSPYHLSDEGTELLDPTYTLCLLEDDEPESVTTRILRKDDVRTVTAEDYWGGCFAKEHISSRRFIRLKQL
jgi:hypothetical protein